MSKTVLITGGTRGVGKALVSKCLSLGYTVISTGSNDRTVDAAKLSSPVYCANKAGLRAFCKSFNGQIKLKGSEIKVCEAILPLVDTDMTRGRGRGKISAEQAANEIIQGPLDGKKEIHIGKMKLLMQARRIFPNLIENIMLKV
ncbi:hypothetical protein ACXR5E_001402 [Vibrio mimicus]